MSDWIDESQELQEARLAEALAKRQKVPQKTGFCLSCEDPTEGAFCSTDCRDFYAKVQRLNEIKGKK